MGDRVFGHLADEFGAERLDRRDVLAAAIGAGVALTGLPASRWLRPASATRPPSPDCGVVE